MAMAMVGRRRALLERERSRLQQAAGHKAWIFVGVPSYSYNGQLSNPENGLV